MNPNLGPLQNNGGLTATHALSADSLPVDGGRSDGAPQFDQRGVARPKGFGVDIGAYEYAGPQAPIPPRLLLSPTSQTVWVGSNLVFQVMASGTPTLKFQWRKDGVEIPGATNRSLPILNAQPGDFGNYTLVVSNPFGMATSQVAHVDIHVPGPIETWYLRQSPKSYVLYSVTYGNGLFVAVGESFSHGVIFTSPDGVIWTQRLDATNQVFSDVAYDNGAFVAVSRAQSINCRCTAIAASSNGVDWTVRNTGYTNPLYAVTAGAGYFVAAGGASLGCCFTGSVLISTTTIDWTVINLGQTPRLLTAAYGNGVFLLGGSVSEGGNYLLRSTNGTAWAGAVLPSSGQFPYPYQYTQNIVYEDGQFIALQQFYGSGNGVNVDVLSSTNGVDWTRRAVVTNGFNRTAYGNGTFVGMGDMAIYSSVDTVTWIPRLQVGPGTFYGIAYGAGTFVAVGAGGTIWQSGDLESAPLATSVLGEGSVNMFPVKGIYHYGDSITLTATPARWYGFNGWSDGPTNNPRMITIGATNSFTAIFTPIAPLETLRFGGVSRTAPAGMPAIFVNGQFITNTSVTNLRSAQIAIQTTFTNGSIFYTRNGNVPTLLSRKYTKALTLRNSTTLRAIGFNSDHSRSWEVDPVQIVIIPAFVLDVTNSGGGSVAISPSQSPYLSNTVLTATATPMQGWAFLQWLGDAIGTNPSATIVMTSDKWVQPVFGTRLNTSVSGNGLVQVEPLAPLYPYGMVCTLTGEPLPGNYFAVWGNAASGTNNPVRVSMTNANPTISAVFAPLSAGQWALTLMPNGRGNITANPRSNRYNSGDLVTLLATPDDNEAFLGWSGDAAGQQNPLVVAMNQSMIIVAHFTSHPRLTGRRPFQSAQSEPFQIFLSGTVAGRYLIERANSIRDWQPWVNVTNLYGTTQICDESSTNLLHRFYRATEIP